DLCTLCQNPDVCNAVCQTDPQRCVGLPDDFTACASDADACSIGSAGSADRTNTTRCFIKSSVNPGLTCGPPSDSDVNGDCNLHDPTAVVVGVPSLDCGDDVYQGTDEIHPVLGMALRIQ